MFDWSEIRNPILTHPAWSLKDPCVALDEAGVVHLFCSAFSPGNRLQLLEVTTRDLVTWSHPVLLWGEGDRGFGSPDITFLDGAWVLTYQSWDPRPGHDRTCTKLHASRSEDLVNWEPRHTELARNLNVGQRAIDPAVTRCGDRVYCIFKQWQEPLMAAAEDLWDPDGWELLGRLPFPESSENGQFLHVDGQWRLIVQTPGAQQIGTMRGDGSHWADWLAWDLEPIRMPTQPGFNEHQNAGALYVADWRERDGFFYGFFHAREVPHVVLNMSHRLGVARSCDLKHWEFPGTSD